MSKKRISKIFELCEQNTTVSVVDLAKRFNVSEATIRRDLLAMEDDHMITRFYGGAKINANVVQEKGYKISSMTHAAEKKAISKYAASLVRDYEIIYIDAGSTTVYMVDYLTARNIMVVTECVSVLDRLVDKNINCYVAGGNLRGNTGVIVGKETIEKIKSLSFTSVFLGANTFSQATGFATTNEEEASMKRAALDSGQKKYILIDSSKFDKMNFYKFAEPTGVTVITDHRLPDFDYSVFDEVVFVDEL
jgi:DeoR family fructose operon transcriptional repressor